MISNPIRVSIIRPIKLKEFFISKCCFVFFIFIFEGCVWVEFVRRFLRRTKKSKTKSHPYCIYWPMAHEPSLGHRALIRVLLTTRLEHQTKKKRTKVWSTFALCLDRRRDTSLVDMALDLATGLVRLLAQWLSSILTVFEEKCSFAQEEILFLGHKIGRGEISMDRQKVLAIEEWEVPKSVTELRSFLGLVNDYRRFISRYSNRAAPLTDLLKKDRPLGLVEEVPRGL